MLFKEKNIIFIETNKNTFILSPAKERSGPLYEADTAVAGNKLNRYIAYSSRYPSHLGSDIHKGLPARSPVATPISHKEDMCRIGCISSFCWRKPYYHDCGDLHLGQYMLGT